MSATKVNVDEGEKPAAKPLGRPSPRPPDHVICCFKGCTYVGFELESNTYPEHQEDMKKQNANQRTAHNCMKNDTQFSGFPFHHQRYLYVLTILEHYKLTILPALRVAG